MGDTRKSACCLAAFIVLAFATAPGYIPPGTSFSVRVLDWTDVLALGLLAGGVYWGRRGEKETRWALPPLVLSGLLFLFLAAGIAYRFVRWVSP